MGLLPDGFSITQDGDLVTLTVDFDDTAFNQYPRYVLNTNTGHMISIEAEFNWGQNDGASEFFHQEQITITLADTSVDGSGAGETQVNPFVDLPVDPVPVLFFLIGLPIVRKFSNFQNKTKIDNFRKFYIPM